MRVSKDMIEVSRNLLMRRGFLVPSDHVRDALTEAVADVPEPEHPNTTTNHNHAVVQWHAAEAKLAKVREWAEDHFDGGEVLAIIDGDG